jgi:Methyltransferase domain
MRDDYLDWLLLVNAGMQHPGNLHLFNEGIRLAPELPMLEIGSFCGLSTNIIQYLKRTHGRSMPLFTSDKWFFEGAENPLPEHAPVRHQEIREYVVETFERSVRRFCGEDLPFAIEATADEFFADWDTGRAVTDLFGRPVTLGGPLGFCYIDGNHTEEYATRDFENCDRHLAPGGLILFDDSGDDSDWEVRNVIRSIKNNPRYEVVAKNPNYLVRKLH